MFFWLFIGLSRAPTLKTVVVCSTSDPSLISLPILSLFRRALWAVWTSGSAPGCTAQWCSVSRPFSPMSCTWSPLPCTPSGSTACVMSIWWEDTLTWYHQYALRGDLSAQPQRSNDRIIHRMNRKVQETSNFFWFLFIEKYIEIHMYT